MTASVIDAGTLFRQHGAFVANFLARLGFHGHDAEDLVQEVFLVAHRRGGFSEGVARPTTWLAEIALRVASTARRTRRRHPEDPDDGRTFDAFASAGTPADAAERTQALRRVQRALDALDLDRRAVFVLFEIEGEPCDAIAAGLGLPISTVYSRLHTARKEFADAHERLLAAERRRAASPQERVRP